MDVERAAATRSGERPIDPHGPARDDKRPRLISQHHSMVKITTRKARDHNRLERFHLAYTAASLRHAMLGVLHTLMHAAQSLAHYDPHLSTPCKCYSSHCSEAGSSAAKNVPVSKCVKSSQHVPLGSKRHPVRQACSHGHIFVPFYFRTLSL